LYLSVRTVALMLLIPVMLWAQEKKIINNKIFMLSLVDQAEYHLNSIAKGRNLERHFVSSRQDQTAMNLWVRAMLTHSVEKENNQSHQFLSVLVDGAVLKYTSAFRKGPWGPVCIVRQAQFFIHAGLHNTNSELQSVGLSHEFIKKDTLKWSELHFYESDELLFNPRPLPQLPDSQAWFKAGLLAATFGGLATLFYTIRSR